MVRKIPAAIGAALGLWVALAGAAAAQMSCDDWNTQAFFERAMTSDVQRCIKADAALEARTEYGWTPLHMAAAFSTTPAVVTALLNAGAALEERTERGFATPLHVAAANSETPAVVTALLNAGAALEARAEYGWTPLHMAVFDSETPAMVTALLSAGADLEARDEDGRTPLH